MKRETPKSKLDAVSTLVLIQQLQSLAVQLKRTPTGKDIMNAARRGECGTYSSFIRAFGTVRNALKAAKLPLNFNQEFSETELIGQLQDLSRALGRPLIKRDVLKASKEGRCATIATFERVFGTPGTAFKRAGVSPTEQISSANLLRQYKALSKKLGRPATIQDVTEASHRGECAGYGAFQGHFGGLEETRLLAGFGRVPRRKFTREELIEQLQCLAKKLGRTPTGRDVMEASIRRETAALKSFRTRFGGHNKALRAAGLQISKQSVVSRGQLISTLQKLAKQLGRRPSQADVNQARRSGASASVATYRNYFGSFGKALKAAGLHQMAGKRGASDNLRLAQYTRTEITELLRRLGEKLGRTPTFDDVQDASRRGECPNATTICRHFGAFSAGLREAGFRVRERGHRGREQLKEQLRQLTRELRRIPTAQDIVRAKGRCATPPTFMRNFGSLAEARKAAGVMEVLEEVGSSGKPPQVRERFQIEALIADLRLLARRLKKPPSETDIRKACTEYGTPGVESYVRVFGGIPAARKAAGIKD